MSDMSILKTASGRIGSIVIFEGQKGTVIETLANMLKIRHDDGTYAWASTDEAEEIALESYLKSVNCPFCKGSCEEEQSLKSFGGETVFKCLKCGQNFSIQRQAIDKAKGKHYCKHCGKKNARQAENGTFKCESCDSVFNKSAEEETYPTPEKYMCCPNCGKKQPSKCDNPDGYTCQNCGHDVEFKKGIKKGWGPFSSDFNDVIEGAVVGGKSLAAITAEMMGNREWQAEEGFTPGDIARCYADSQLIYGKSLKEKSKNEEWDNLSDEEKEKLKDRSKREWAEDDKKKIKKDKIVDDKPNKCPSCGKDKKENPQTGKYYCEGCGWEEERVSKSLSHFN